MEPNLLTDYLQAFTLGLVLAGLIVGTMHLTAWAASALADYNDPVEDDD